MQAADPQQAWKLDYGTFSGKRAKESTRETRLRTVYNQ